MVEFPQLSRIFALDILLIDDNDNTAIVCREFIVSILRHILRHTCSITKEISEGSDKRSSRRRPIHIHCLEIHPYILNIPLGEFPK